MSLKSLIQRLLDSRTTPEEAGHSAMPINIANATNLTMDVGAEGSYTAPADGYLSLMVEPGGNINLWGQILPISSFPIQNVQGKLFVPMAKGMEVRYYINGTVSLAKFLKTIGGGVSTLKKFILQGGVLCRLKHLCKSLRRNSCRVRDRGFNTQLVRPWMQRPSALQPTVIGTRLHPAGTVMSHTLETPQALFWKSLMAVQVSLILNRLQDGILFLYRKVKNLVISFQQIQQCRICTLSLCEEKTNFAVGGASC